MKKILIGLMFLMASSAAFADTLLVVKFETKKLYKNMKPSLGFTLKDNEYNLTDKGLYYKVNGKTYLTTMFEISFSE